MAANSHWFLRTRPQAMLVMLGCSAALGAGCMLPNGDSEGYSGSGDPLESTSPYEKSTSLEDFPEMIDSVDLEVPVRISGVQTRQGRPVTLRVVRTRAVDKDTVVIVDGDEEHPQSPNLDPRFFGEVVGEPDSWAALAMDATTRTVRGEVSFGGAGYTLEGTTLHRDETAKPDEPWGCGADEPRFRGTFSSEDLNEEQESKLVRANRSRVINIVIETDSTLVKMLGGDRGVSSYVGDIFSYSTRQFEREVGASLRVSKINIRTGKMPWDRAPSVQDAYNTFDRVAGRGGVTVLLLGRKAGGAGGVAGVGSLCRPGGGAAVVRIKGKNAKVGWDQFATTHELGHATGSPHSHSYSPPVDRCDQKKPIKGCTGQCGVSVSYCFLTGQDMMAPTFGKNFKWGYKPERVANTIASKISSCVGGGGSGSNNGGGGSGSNNGGGGSGSNNGGGGFDIGDSCSWKKWKCKNGWKGKCTGGRITKVRECS